ncbi:helix-turn-helix domain-containing protein [Frateuria aurantia]
MLQLDCAIRGRFVLPDDVCLLAHVADVGPLAWCHGIPFSEHTAVWVQPRGISEFMLSAGARLVYMVIRQDWLKPLLASASSEAPLSVNACASHFSLDEESVAPGLLQGYEAIAGELLAVAETGSTGVIAEWTDEELLREVALAHVRSAMLPRPDERGQTSRSMRTHYLILQRVEHFMRSQLRKDIYLHEMCNAGGVSERTLRYVFENMVGTSPNRYLAMLRLCMAYRSLARADISRKSVKSVALSYGLWDLSRFADNYRRIFGELPRDTLSGGAM